MKQKILTILVLCLLAGSNVQYIFAYPDVLSSHQNYEAITYLTENSIVKGYPDGTFGPDGLINRAEFLKIIIEGVMGTPQEPMNGCFPDVRAGEWYAKYVCQAKSMGVISGYPDGYYRPADTINLVEALKIVVEAYDIPTEEAEPWYAPYVNIMSESRYIPNSFTTLDEKVERGEMAEIIWRLLENVKDRPFVTTDQLEETHCNNIGDDVPSSVDMGVVRQAWLNTINTERIKEGLHPYALNDQLNRTAADWSKYMRDRGYIDHKREGVTAYYDYNNIKQWFLARGLDFKNVYSVTFSENIGAGSFSCNLNDCTNHVIANMRPTFEMYMAEKNAISRPHYSSVMNAYFHEIGVGIAVGGSKMYITTHYGTEIISDPLPICETGVNNENTFSGGFGYYRP